MARYKNPVYSGSDNQWSRGFSNLGTALFGDPTAADNAALDASREAQTIKTYEEINRGLREDTALTSLADRTQQLWNRPDGMQISAATINAALPEIFRQNILSGYAPDDLASLFNMGTAYGGDEELARRGMIATGTDPGLDFAVTPQMAERIRREKPIELNPGQRAYVPPPIYPQASNAAPPMDGGSIQTAALPTTLVPRTPPTWLAATIADAAKLYNVPEAGLQAVGFRESKFDPNAVGSSGEHGVWQFMPETAAELGVDPLDPQESTYGAARYLRQLYDQTGDWESAVAAYNWGIGNLQDQGIANAPAITKDYLAEVMPYFGQSTGNAAGAPPESVSNVFSEGGVIEAPAAPDKARTVNVPANTTVVEIPAGGGSATPLYTSPGKLDADGNVIVGGSGRATGKSVAPDVRTQRQIDDNVAKLLQFPAPSYMAKLYEDMGIDGYNEFSSVLDKAWFDSKGNINLTAAAGAKWVKDNFDVQMPTGIFGGPTGDVDAKRLTPATPAATAAPAATEYKVGEVYETPAGKLRYTGEPGGEWEEP